MEQRGSHQRDVDDFYISDFFKKYVKKVQGSLKSDKNNGYFT
jgi:hypothetical protein